jgi:hypothetical protein
MRLYNSSNCFGNLAYLGILKETSKVYSYTKNELRAEELLQKARQLEKALIKAFYDYDTGLFNISKTSSYHNFHDAVFALYFGLQLPKDISHTGLYKTEESLRCVLYILLFLSSIHYREYDKIFELMVSDEEIHGRQC